ncbi:MAG TPA: restriction endonuclease subunit S [Saprospiraceae bacterium]|nr:restriction endonuclease subunit S [Saprospiraceae bacterium]
MKDIINNKKQLYNTEIPTEWVVKKLSECCLVKGDYGINAPAVEFENNLPVYLRITDIDDNGNYSLSKKVSVNDPNYKQFILNEGDIVFVRTGATVGKTYLYKPQDGILVFAGFLIRFRTNDNVLTKSHLKYFTETKHYWDWVKTISMRSGQPGINAEEYGSLLIPLPPLPEQKAITSVLSTWDDAIHKTEKIITQKELRKKWLMQQLLTGKKRLKGFETRYKKQTVEEVLLPVRNSLSPESNVLYRQIGIRSHGKGIFLKEMVEGKIIGNKRVFWIEPDCLILNIVFAWEQAIAITRKDHIGMIASHRFPMFKPLPNKLDLEYILYFFKSPRGKQMLVNASPGGAGRNKTLGQNEFLNQILNLPSVEEQTVIAHVLQAADKEITLLRAKADKLREQKKGLMQMLLTGKKRLKINNN